jgi:hypothetical protein
MLLPVVGREIFKRIPINAAENVKFVPPKLRNGSGCPVVGISPTHTQT